MTTYDTELDACKAWVKEFDAILRGLKWHKGADEAEPAAVSP